MAADDSKFEFLVLPSDTLQSKSKEATELFKKWWLTLASMMMYLTPDVTA